MLGLLAVLRNDHVDASSHVAMQLERNLVLAQRPDRLLHVDLVPVDLNPMLRLQRAGDVLVRDRAERLVLGSDLQPNHDSLVVDLVGDGLRLVALLRLPLDRSVAQTLRLSLRPLSRRHRQLAPQQEVAAVPVGDFLHIACAADIVDIFRQQDPQFHPTSEMDSYSSRWRTRERIRWNRTVKPWRPMPTVSRTSR